MRVTKGDNVNHESAIHNSGNVVIMVWWDFSRGGAYSAFRWETRKREKKKKEKKKGEKKNFVNLRRQRRQRRADFSNRYESPELTGERAGFILFHAPTTTTTTPSSLCLSPYPHFHKHIQLSRHGTARHGTARQPSHYYSPVKVALPQSTSPK